MVSSKKNQIATVNQRYNKFSVILHWVLGFAIVVAFAVGVYMADLPLSPDKLQLYAQHKWAGIVILFLSALRLLWRLVNPPPALPEAIGRQMPAWQHIAHHGTHYALYALFFMVPLIGWAFSSAAGFPVVLFGVWQLPDFVPVDKALAEMIKPWHGRMAMLLALLVVLHVAAAFKHQFIDKDHLLDRMRLG